MAEKKSTFLNMVLTLFLVTFLSSFILGFVQDMTSDAIDAAKMKAQNDAIKSILPEFTELGESFKSAPKERGDSLEFFPAYNQKKELVGVAVKTYSKNGFGGLIQIMAGFSPDGTITGYQVLAHKETPGLGSRMGAWFSDPEKPGQNIIGKNPGKENFTVRKDGGDIDAITASTITSRAFLEAVRRAYEVYKDDPGVDSITSQTKKTEGGKHHEPME
jgi:electron transport complex protein RnfG